MAKGKVVPALN